MFRLVALLSITFAAHTAMAVSGPPEEAQPAPVTSPAIDPASVYGRSDLLSAGLGAGLLDGDYYLQSRTLLDLDFGRIGVGLGLPLNLLVYSANEPPTRAEKTYFHFIRKADFPALTTETYSKYLQVLRYFHLGQKRDPVYLSVGQMFGATMGHGTIIDRYNNSLDISRPRLGLAFDLNSSVGGIETFVDDVAFPATQLAGARIYVRPFGEMKIPFLEKLAIGATATTDRLAPRVLQTSATDASGQPCTPSCNAIGENGLPIAAEASAFNVYGVDLELEVLHSDVVQLIPYMDMNFQPRGKGFHMGVLTNLRLPVFQALKVWSRAEFRVLEAGYIPGYFDAAYDQQRFIFPVGDKRVPKAKASYELSPEGQDLGLYAGYFAEASADLMGIVRGGATFSSVFGLPNTGNLMVFATLPYFTTIKISGYYLRKNFDAAKEIFTLDERSILTASAYYHVAGPLYVGAQFHRSWRTDPVSGQIAAFNDWNVGVQAFKPL